MDGLKHILSGGFWLDLQKGWIQAGSAVLKVLHEQPILQRHIGWVPADTIHPGAHLSTIKFLSLKRC